MEGLTDPRLLPAPQRSALAAAAEMMIDTWPRELCAATHREPIDPDGMMAATLPSKHAHRYDRDFAVRYLGALFVVIDRLGDPDLRGQLCGSTAEELAFMALIDAAVELLGEDEDDEPLWSFRARMVEDTDVELLFDPALDGIEAPELHVATSPPVNLEFDRWFDRFRGSWPQAEA